MLGCHCYNEGANVVKPLNCNLRFTQISFVSVHALFRQWGPTPEGTSCFTALMVSRISLPLGELCSVRRCGHLTLSHDTPGAVGVGCKGGRGKGPFLPRLTQAASPHCDRTALGALLPAAPSRQNCRGKALLPKEGSLLSKAVT